MKLGIRGHDIYDGKTSAENLVSALKQGGFDTVQLVCHKSIEGVDYKPGYLPRNVTKITEGMDGFHIALLGAYFNPVHPDESVVNNGISVFKENLENAKTIGADTVGTETGSYQGDPWIYHPKNRTPEALNRVVRILSELAAVGCPLEVFVGIEGAAGHVLFDPKTLKQAIDSIKMPNIRVIFDYFNFCDEENRDYIRILDDGLSLFPKIHCFHIKDFLLDSMEQVPVGQGDVDFKKLLSLIKQYDKDAIMILEGTPQNEAARSAAFLREIWRDAGA